MIIMSLCIVSFAWQSTFRRSLQYNYTPSAQTFQIISKIFHVFHYFFAFAPACRGDFIINIRKTSEISKRLRDFFKKVSIFSFLVPETLVTTPSTCRQTVRYSPTARGRSRLMPIKHKKIGMWNLQKQNWFISY